MNETIEMIIWRDTTTGPDPNWQESEYDFKLAVAYSAGFLVKEDDSTVTICQSLCYDHPDDNPKYAEEVVRDAYIKIPKSLIVKRDTLVRITKIEQ